MMNSSLHEKVILSLIKDDLIHTKLLNGLGSLGIPADHYLLNLSESIFEMMGIHRDPNHEVIYQLYMTRLKEVRYVEIGHSNDNLDNLALDIYNELRYHSQSFSLLQRRI